ncbi:MAG TPA: toxic anion resistance protein [Dongiaceae bacterium]|nr:toxic anion resistance protein [Dongiaceae bacterium]
MSTTDSRNPGQPSLVELTQALDTLSSEIKDWDHGDALQTAEGRAVVAQKVAELDRLDSHAVIHFGTAAQSGLQAISQEMLGGVRNKDMGKAGDTLRDMVTSLRGFSTTELDPNRPPSWWEKLLGKAKPAAEFISRYEGVRDQIDRISQELMQHETVLLKDIKSLDKLYERTLAFYRELAFYIAAGETKLRQLDNETIPNFARDAAATSNDSLLAAQKLRDLRTVRDDLERRVHDLKLTRQVTMQSLPSIRLVQENDKALVIRINSALVNTVPLWETQLAQAITIGRSQEAANTIRAVNDLTNELLTQNAENLRQANRTVREQNERGVFDMESIKLANANLIATIEESLQIADDGRKKRVQAEQELKEMEGVLKNALQGAAQKQQSPAATE